MGESQMHKQEQNYNGLHLNMMTEAKLYLITFKYDEFIRFQEQCKIKSRES